MVLLPVLLLHLAPVDSAGLGGGASVRGTVQRGTKRKGPCRAGNCEWLNFDIVVGEAGGERVVAIEMQKMVIEGTVFEDHTVLVEGNWNDRNALKANRITDLTTGATIAHNSATPRYAVNRRLTLRGEVIRSEATEPPGPGQKNKKEKLRFVIRLDNQDPAQEDVLISVEVVKPRIWGFLGQNSIVAVEGVWTNRNVLRADTVTDIKSGKIIR